MASRFAETPTRPPLTSPEEFEHQLHLLDDGGDLRELGHVLQLEREHMRAAAGGRDPRELIADNFPRCLWAVLHIYVSKEGAQYSWLAKKSTPA